MKKRSGSSRIFTVPNILSIFRLLLIPPIIIFYVFIKNYIAAVILIIVSGATDVLDGMIARKFNQVTDVGKILDPIADKLTQGTILLCLASRYKYLWILVVYFVIKEVFIGVLGLLVIKRVGQVDGAQWYGKLCTTATLTLLGLLVLIPGIPDGTAYIIGSVCAVFVTFSLVMYSRFFIKELKEAKASSNRVSEE